MSEETTKKTFQNLLEYLEVNKRKTAVYFDTLNYPKFKAAFSALTIALPEWKNNPSTYLAELLITLSAKQLAAPAPTESDNKHLIADIENAHREAVNTINEAHSKQLETLQQQLTALKAEHSKLQRTCEVALSKVEELTEENTNLGKENESLQTENTKLKTNLDTIAAQAEKLKMVKTVFPNLREREKDMLKHLLA